MWVKSTDRFSILIDSFQVTKSISLPWSPLWELISCDTNTEQLKLSIWLFRTWLQIRGKKMWSWRCSPNLMGKHQFGKSVHTKWRITVYSQRCVFLKSFIILYEFLCEISSNLLQLTRKLRTWSFSFKSLDIGKQTRCMSVISAFTRGEEEKQEFKIILNYVVSSMPASVPPDSVSKQTSHSKN